MTTNKKIALLREKMSEKNIDAFIIYSADPHMSEYLPLDWQERSWISGFTGSAGFIVITQNQAALWTDGRYFVQASQELKNSEIILMKDGLDETPYYIDWIISNIPENGNVGVNALTTSHINWKILENTLSKHHISLLDKSLLKEIWKNRETETKHKIFIHPLKWAGKSIKDKLTNIRTKMEEKGVSTHIISSLDDVAWTLNLRGSDVECNPVFLSYIVLNQNECRLYVDLEKVNSEVKKYLEEHQVKIFPYSEFFDDLKQISNEKILISSNSNELIFKTLENNNLLIEAPVPGNLMKAIKNDVELEGFRTVMVRDGVSLAKFFYWLTHQAGKEKMTEYSVGKKLKEFRAEGKNFVGESFGSIIGYEGNGAIVHYSAKENDCKEITNKGSLLIDSGGQYLEGTTDITRVVALGDVSDDFIKNSTLVLKGMINLSLTQFPKGTCGFHLDAIARRPLWNKNKDYAHGTGHGVGSFMNVHEGPQNIRKDINIQTLIPGMVCSNEPGFYFENQYGIRHENLVAVREGEKTPYGTFYYFETLTLCPFFKNTLDPSLLDDVEKEWLNAYHKTCEEKIVPHLDGEIKEWFLDLVKPII